MRVPLLPGRTICQIPPHTEKRTSAAQRIDEAFKPRPGEDTDARIARYHALIATMDEESAAETRRREIALDQMFKSFPPAEQDLETQMSFEKGLREYLILDVKTFPHLRVDGWEVIYILINGQLYRVIPDVLALNFVIFLTLCHLRFSGRLNLSLARKH